jgi:excisionase family DNA binding protein
MDKGIQKAHWIGSPLRKRMYTIKEAAIYLGLSEWTVRSLVWAGSLPFMKIEGGRKQLLDVHDLDAYINRNKISHLGGAV